MCRSGTTTTQRVTERTAMAAIESPCNKICVIDPLTRLCAGCGRSTAEIENWLQMSSHERARVMMELPDRRRRNAVAPMPPN
jgi:predicted Fe-S protein YdhL (DUF1289 family)